MLVDEHPVVTRSLVGIAVVHARQGNHPQALLGFKEALRAQRARLGDEHPDIGATHMSMGNAHTMVGEDEEALECYNKALTIGCETVGEESGRLRMCGTIWRVCT
mmetsp:Transcript_37106/g.91315  ORF Transcript_37106/g.91315 Transcript_37106/m.91315 type:complete len:105 (+) Transcript_37106:838-1152(+)